MPFFSCNEIDLKTILSSRIIFVFIFLKYPWYDFQKGRLPRFEDVLDGIGELPSKCEIEPESASASA